MKNLVPWIKSNLLTVIALAVAVIALPVAWFFANGMRSSIAEEASQETSRAERSISEATMTYEIPPIEPGGVPWTATAPPNDRLIRNVVAQRRSVSEAGDAVKSAVIEKNQAGKSLLVESLFPEPVGGESGPLGRVRLTDAMVDAWGAYPAQLLGAAGAGGPPDSATVLSRIQQLRDQRAKEITAARASEALTAEEQEELTEELTARRIELYQEHAAGLSFYANADGLFASRATFNPDVTPNRDTFLRVFWGWQHTAWVERDIVEALRQANDGYAGPLEGPVKRVSSIAVEPWEPVEVSGDSLTGEIAGDLTTAHTGRTGGNAFYDVRYATVDLIAEAGRVNELVDAFASVNFMTVIDMDIEHIGVEPDLALGFSYGPTPVVRASIELETVWVRSWYDALIPATVRASKGLPALEDPSEDGDEAGFDDE